MRGFALSARTAAGRVVLLGALAASLACKETFTAEIYIDPPTPLVVNERADITVVAHFPPEDAVYRWRTDLGACDPQDSTALATTYTPKRIGRDRIRLEVLSSGSVILRKEIQVEVVAGSPGEPPAVSAVPPDTPGEPTPTIHITNVPPYDEVGGGERFSRIAGSVVGASPERWRVVLYACTNVCYVQPWTKDPYTAIQPNGRWSNRTFLGREYVALLVEPDFVPTDQIPRASHPMNGVIARRIVSGAIPSTP